MTTLLCPVLNCGKPNPVKMEVKGYEDEDKDDDIMITNKKK